MPVSSFFYCLRQGTARKVNAQCERFISKMFEFAESLSSLRRRAIRSAIMESCELSPAAKKTLSTVRHVYTVESRVGATIVSADSGHSARAQCERPADAATALNSNLPFVGVVVKAMLYRSAPPRSEGNQMAGASAVLNISAPDSAIKIGQSTLSSRLIRVALRCND
jgi:hypothetical protein